jgi:hypothetical protein
MNSSFARTAETVYASRVRLEKPLPLQLGALREALIEAGASPEKAAKAAEEVGTYENRLAGIEAKLALLDGRVNLVQWMLGFNLAMTLAVAGRLFLTH